jgi:hypothetical protein
VQHDWSMGRVQVICATIAFGRWLQISCVGGSSDTREHLPAAIGNPLLTVCVRTYLTLADATQEWVSTSRMSAL